jgi:hypothetical protein
MYIEKSKGKCLSRQGIFVARATRCLFLFKIRKFYFKVSKSCVIFSDVDNFVSYKRVKFQFQIPYIQSSIKMTKSDSFEVLKVYTKHVSDFISLYIPYYKVF